MTPEEADKRLREEIAGVFDPCTGTHADIEAMLAAVGGDALSDEQVDRILQKAAGKLPIGERDVDPPWLDGAVTEADRELLALHKNEGDQLPPEVKEKLRKLREKAKKEDEVGENGDDELES